VSQHLLNRGQTIANGLNADSELTIRVTTPFPLNRGQTEEAERLAQEWAKWSQHLFLLIEVKLFLEQFHDDDLFHYGSQHLFLLIEVKHSQDFPYNP